MDDSEPMSKNGEFWHPRLLKDQVTPRTCANVGKAFYLDELGDPEKRKEIEPFMRKAVRRKAKRAGAMTR